jgi:hypothetical protein
MKRFHRRRSNLDQSGDGLQEKKRQKNPAWPSRTMSAAKTIFLNWTLPVAADGLEVRRHRSADQEQDWQAGPG